MGVVDHVMKPDGEFDGLGVDGVITQFAGRAENFVDVPECVIVAMRFAIGCDEAIQDVVCGCGTDAITADETGETGLPLIESLG
jgi:hypothetical protein